MSAQNAESPNGRLAGKRLSPALLPFLFACVTLLAPAAALGQGKQVAPLTALELAKRVDQHYNRLHCLKAGFTEQYQGLGIERSESGTMLLRKPGRMRWEYQGTPGKVFVLDGKFAWFYAPGDTQVQRIAASQLDDLRSPVRFLLGHTKIESEIEGLDLTLVGQMGQAAALHTLTGVPKGQQKRITKLSLTINQDGAIVTIVIEEVDGAKTQFNFTGEEPNAVLPDSAFHFSPPAGVPVVDALPPV